MSDVVVLPADKGNATVLMNKDDYHAKIATLLKSGNYSVLKKDPTKTQENKVCLTL